MFSAIFLGLAETAQARKQGGHGRTGLIVSIIIGILFDMHSDEAMKICDKLYRLRENPSLKLSPHRPINLDIQPLKKATYCHVYL
ncbi:unnamed protein product [Didymodactylos carnosus]|uniref:Uncharacterized protein n=1 Tax=Didymodactylos carnosus TaxID=1234261 RepID=A0A814AJD2_9BILA|nr:unnamed protein product [Didymodactylos carnosus]CAF3694224.1 unnamed protein product [Didymodactylos carnosus]